MLKPRNDARLSPCEDFWQKHNGFLCEKPILPYEHSAKFGRLIFCFLQKKSAIFIVIYDKFTYILLYTFNENQHEIRFMLKTISKLW